MKKFHNTSNNKCNINDSKNKNRVTGRRKHSNNKKNI